MPTAPTAPSNSFDLLKEFFNDDVENENETITDQDAEADDATMNGSNKSSPSLTRITFKVPADELAKDKAKAILLVAKEVLDCFQAEFPTMKLLPWKTENVSPLSCTRKSLPTDPKLAESFLFGYSRFFAKPSGIFRVLFQHDSPIAREEIEEFAKLNINQPRIQFLQPAQSDAIQPTILGFLTGSTPDMASSPAVEAVLKKTFNIKVLGMQWKTINIKNPPASADWRVRQALQLEVDAVESRNVDLPKAMNLYFNSAVRDANKCLFGTTMMFVTTPPGWQSSSAISARVRTQCIGQASIVKSISAVGLDNVDLLNVINGDGTTLMEALISLPSIVAKKNKSGKEIFGRLFHAITPSADPNCYTVSFFNVNMTEASSVIAALPRFIESEFNISATSFCRTIFIESAKAGKWNPDTRVFLSQEDLAMDAMLEQIVELADAPAAQVVISSDHQRAMAMTEDDANTQATDLRDRSPAPLDTNADDMSALTGSTRTSKADRIADERVQAVQQQHLLAMDEQNQKYAFLEKQIAALIAATTAPPTANTLTPDSAKHGSTVSAPTTTTNPPFEHIDPKKAPHPDDKKKMQETERTICEHNDMVQREHTEEPATRVEHMVESSVEEVGESSSSSSSSDSDSDEDDNDDQATKNESHNTSPMIKVHSSDDNDSDNNDPSNVVGQAYQNNSSGSNSADGDDEAESDDNGYQGAENPIGSTSDHHGEEYEEEHEEENEEDKDQVEYIGTSAPAYSMYDVSDAHDPFDRRCIPEEDFDLDELDVEHLPDFETEDEYKTDEGGPESDLPWSSQFDSTPVRVVATLSKTSNGTTVAHAQKKKATLTLDDFDSSGLDTDDATQSPARFRKNQDAKHQFPTRVDDNTRYLTRSKAATTTGAPEGGCSP
jgi:hypothetical protein